MRCSKSSEHRKRLNLNSASSTSPAIHHMHPTNTNTVITSQQLQPQPQPHSLSLSKRSIRLFLSFFSIILVMSVLWSRLRRPEKPSSLSSRAIATSLESVESINSFTFKLFSIASSLSSSDNDFLLSPYTLASVLHLVRLGTTPNSIARAEFSKLLPHFETPPTIKSPHFISASSIWAQKQIRSEYKESISSSSSDTKVYGPPFTGTDINAWVLKSTNGKIDQIVPDMLPRDVIAVLLSTVYFKAPWTSTFPESNTTRKEFILANGRTTFVNMMTLSSFRTPYTFISLENDYSFHVVQLPYGESKQFAMTLFIPLGEKYHSKACDVIKETLSKSPKKWIDDWKKDLQPTVLNELGVPRFRTEYSADTDQLKSWLGKLGLSKIFESDMNNPPLAAMTDDKKAYVSDFMHKTILECTEKGTEAAAVAAAVVMTRSLGSQSPTVIADRPFVYLIHERESGLILFMGQVNNPTDPV